MATVTQIENCAAWNMRESEVSLDKAKTERDPADREYHARRAERLDVQAFRLFRAAHDMRNEPSRLAA